MTTIFLLRHGAIARTMPHVFIGRQDLPLTPEGYAAMAKAADYLLPYDIADIIASPLQRCRQSADILAARLPCKNIVVRQELREISLGSWEGQPIDVIRQTNPTAYAARGQDPMHFRPPGGESFADLSARVWPVFEEIRREYDKRIVCIVAHAGVNRVILAKILQTEPSYLFALKQDYGCINEIYHDGTGYLIKKQNYIG